MPRSQSPLLVAEQGQDKAASYCFRIIAAASRIMVYCILCWKNIIIMRGRGEFSRLAHLFQRRWPASLESSHPSTRSGYIRRHEYRHLWHVSDFCLFGDWARQQMQILQL